MNFQKILSWQTLKQKSEAWFNARKKITTASQVPSIVELSPFKSKHALFNQKLLEAQGEEVTQEHSPAIEWGENHEDRARNFYSTLPSLEGPIKVHQVGLVVHPKYPWLGASPDGVVEGKNGWWLLEIKCPLYRKIRAGSIPLYIWVQVQIQLEVCQLPFCHLLQCEYNENSILKHYRLTTIQRNKEWFHSVAYPEIVNFQELIERAQQYQFVKNPYPNLEEWVRTKDFVGHSLGDPVLDWLDQYKYSPLLRKYGTPQYTASSHNRQISRQALYNSFVELFKRSLPENEEFHEISPLEEKDRELFSTRRYRETQHWAQKGVAVLGRPVLLGYRRKVAGIADFLVRNDIALRFFQERIPKENCAHLDYLECALEKKGLGYTLICLSLKKPRKNQISETKESKVSDRSSQEDNRPHYSETGTLLRRSARLQAKNKFVEEKKEVEEEEEDIPKKKQWTRWEGVLQKQYSLLAENVDALLPKKGPQTLVVFLGSDFCTLVKPSILEKELVSATKGITWARLVKREGEKWLTELNHSSLPPHHDLFPNMCNRYDQKMRSIKLKLAEKWGELTLLWYCGLQQRERAHLKGIYSWRQLHTKKIAPEEIVLSLLSEAQKKNLEKKKSRRRRIMESMIRLNRTSNKIFHSLSEGKLEEPYSYITGKTQEFYVDFEVLPGCHIGRPESLIYLIGMGWVCPESKQWSFRSFVSQDLSKKAELVMLQSWWSEVKRIKKQAEAKRAVLYHWSGAETRFLADAQKRHNLYFISKTLDKNKAEWRDLMEMFLEAEVVIRGVWGYSLKDVAKGLHKHGLVPAVWEIGTKGNTLNSGEGTLVTASSSYRQAENMGISVENVSQFSLLRKYNQMDCRVLYDLLLFLRKHVYCPKLGVIENIPWQAKDSPISGKALGEIWGKKRKRSRSLRGKRKSKKQKMLNTYE